MPDPQDPITPPEASVEAVPVRLPDPGTARSRLVALVASVLVFLSVAVLQSWPSAPPPASEGPPAGLEAAGQQTDIAFRMVIKMSDLFRSDPKSIDVMAKWAKTPPEKVYLGIALGEVEGPDAAIEQLEAARAEAESEQLQQDIDVFEQIYRDAEADTPPAIDPAVRQGLEDRHGFYARVALTYPLPKEDPERAQLRSGAGSIVVMVLGVVAIGAGIVVGFGLFFTGIVLLALRRFRTRFERPAPGGSVFLETFALFVGLFLALKLSGLVVVAIVGEENAGWLTLAMMAAQWCLLLVPFWPVLRGMPFGQWRRAIGLHTGEGLFKEMGCGIVAYLGSIPLYIGAIVLVFALLALKAILVGEPEAPPTNPMIELVEHADPLLLALFFFTATVWAPLCEELIFRGAVYRHLRGYFPAVVAGLFSSVLFAFMHNYGPLLTPPLIVLGFVFCMMREWRGSLVASMTAHALHNGTLLIVLFSLIRALG